jgi:predicted amidohydrolase YtcJ
MVYSAFEEVIKSRIEGGKLADFTIYNQDLTTAAEDRIIRHPNYHDHF